MNESRVDNLDSVRLELERKEALLREMRERLESTAKLEIQSVVVGSEYVPPDPIVYGGYSDGAGGGGAYQDIVEHSEVKSVDPVLQSQVEALEAEVSGLRMRFH